MEKKNVYTKRKKKNLLYLCIDKKDFSLWNALSSACRIMANWLHGQPWDQACNLQVKGEAPSTAHQT